MNEREVITPYNFVPFSRTILIRYENKDEIPPHDVIDPALKSGEIHIRMSAETPIFVSDGAKDNAARFFHGSNGKMMIPGSTIKGMVRQNMQILGFGAVLPKEDIADYQIYYREMASSRRSIGSTLKNHYHTILGTEVLRSPSEKMYSIPHKVQAGYLQKQEGRYIIHPVKGTYLKVSRNHPDVAALQGKDGSAIDIWYTLFNEERTFPVEHIYQTEQQDSNIRRGMLLYTGKPIAKLNHLYVFPEVDEQAEAIEISPEDMLSYMTDWEGRVNALKGGEYNPDFWAPPKEGEKPKPVFYVRHNGHTFFGMSLFLRIGHDNNLMKGLPKTQQNLYLSGKYPLDYVRTMLGYTNGKESFRSRVAFGDFEVVGDPEEMELVDLILGPPQPSFYPGYVVDGKDYSSTDDFELRGYKQYWLKEAGAPVPEKMKVASHMRPLPPKTAFQGVIRYKNLHEDELGLLLWALRLEDGCYQSVGMGKPYGYGRMKLTIQELREWDFSQMYCYEGLRPKHKRAREKEIADYIAKYEKYVIAQIYRNRQNHNRRIKSLKERIEIQDFLFIHSVERKREEVRYMELEEYKNIPMPLPDLDTIRREYEAEQERNRPKTLEEALEALLAKNSHL